jgi:hypothetical protein
VRRARHVCEREEEACVGVAAAWGRGGAPSATEGGGHVSEGSMERRRSSRGCRAGVELAGMESQGCRRRPTGRARRLGSKPGSGVVWASSAPSALPRIVDLPLC